MMTEHEPVRPLGLLHRLGLLRLLLIGAAFLVMLAAPFADGGVHLHDWRLLPSVVAPSVMMMLVFALPLDITMACVFMADAPADEARRLRSVVLIEAGVLVAMLLAWAPFMLKVLDFTPLVGD